MKRVVTAIEDRSPGVSVYLRREVAHLFRTTQYGTPIVDRVLPPQDTSGTDGLANRPQFSTPYPSARVSFAVRHAAESKTVTADISDVAARPVGDAALLARVTNWPTGRNKLCGLLPQLIRQALDALDHLFHFDLSTEDVLVVQNRLDNELP